jgi:hypothetical protein
MKGTTEKYDKTYRALRTCKGTFGKTWGLKPRVVNGIYTLTDLQLHGFVAKGQIKCQQDGDQ